MSVCVCVFVDVSSLGCVTSRRGSGPLAQSRGLASQYSLPLDQSCLSPHHKENSVALSACCSHSREKKRRVEEVGKYRIGC